MKIYPVFNSATGYAETFYNLIDAKKAMKENNAKGEIFKMYANGDTVHCGEIKIGNNNKTFIANTRQKKSGY
jgi:hypothetical protein